MKKVLILAHDFPPYNSIAAQRPASWLRYFHEYGWHPIIVTRHWDRPINNPIDYIRPSINNGIEVEQNGQNTVIRTPYEPNLRDRFLLRFGLARFAPIRKVLSLLISIGEFYFFRLDATAKIYHAANHYLSENKVDAIIATGQPFLLFRYAQKLSKKHNIPWIADYRDGWTIGPSQLSMSTLQKLLNKQFFKRLEKKIVQTAAHITTAAPSYTESIQFFFPSKHFSTIYNGFYEEVFQNLPAPTSHPTFTIAYAGSIHPHQNLECFLEGLLLFLNNKNLFADEAEKQNVQVVFYGIEFYPSQKSRVFSFNSKLNSFIKTTQRLPYEEVIAKLAEADILILLSKKGAEWLNAKVFDYLALDRPVLLAESDQGILSSIIDSGNAGVACETAESVAYQLTSRYMEWKKNGFTRSPGAQKGEYSRRHQAKRLCQLLDKTDISYMIFKK